MTGVVAVTGATGYLGGLLVERFQAEGWEAVRLVRSPGRGSDRAFHLGEEVPPGTLAGVDLLIHTAYDMKVVTEADIWKVNVEGTRQLLEAAAEAGVERTIVLSSMSAYDGTRQLYGRAKLEIETISAANGAIVVRPGLVVGPGAGGMAGALIKMVRLPLTPTVGGAGRQFPVAQRDFVDAVYRLATTSGTPPTEPLGLAFPQPMAFNDLLRAMARDAGVRPPRLIPIPWRAIHAGLRLGERLGVGLPFRADSLLGLVHPAPFVPGVAALAEVGIKLNSPFEGFVPTSDLPPGQSDLAEGDTRKVI